MPDNAGFSLTALALVALGGAAGSALRFLVSESVGRLARGVFPWGTLVVNVSGAFAAGCLVGLLAASSDNAAPAWTLLGVGLIGSYTTVSALAIQLQVLTSGGERRLATLYLLASLGLGLPAAALGLWVGG